MTSIELRPWLDALVQRGYRGMSLGRERIDRALEGLGRPHERLSVVHVAGTNGKGSVCAMVEAAARSQGLRTGLYTSPHLCRVAERIRIDGEPIADDAFADGLRRVLSAEPADLTFFEALTAVALDAFARQEVDLAILEVGLGGRHDATNVIDRPLAVAICSVDYDHQNLLGDTIAQIAREKAGILKRGVPAVIGELSAEAADVVRAEARSIGAGPVSWVRRDGAASDFELYLRYRVPQDAEGAVDLEFPGRRRRLRPGLAGEHQAHNAAVAWGLLEYVFPRAPRPDPDRAAEAIAGVTWPGRLERIRGEDLSPPRGGVEVLLDCAHNPAGAHALARHLGEAHADRRILVFGALADKAWETCLEEIAPLAARRIYTCPKGRPAAPIERLTSIAPGEAEPDPVRAIERALDAARPGTTVLVTGSIYLVGEVRAHLLGIDADPVIAL